MGHTCPLETSMFLSLWEMSVIDIKVSKVQLQLQWAISLASVLVVSRALCAYFPKFTRHHSRVNGDVGSLYGT